jgi:hypothetical protein
VIINDAIDNPVEKKKSRRNFSTFVVAALTPISIKYFDEEELMQLGNGKTIKRDTFGCDAHIAHNCAQCTECNI